MSKMPRLDGVDRPEGMKTFSTGGTIMEEMGVGIKKVVNGFLIKVYSGPENGCEKRYVFSNVEEMLEWLKNFFR